MKLQVILLSLLFIFSTSIWSQSRRERIPLQELKGFADQRAQSLWGNVYPSDPIPYYGYDDEVMGYMFLYRKDAVFPSRNTFSSSQRSVVNKNQRWGLNEYGKILLGNDPNYSFMIERSSTLPPELAMIDKIEDIAYERLGVNARFDRVYYFNHYRQWARYTNGSEVLYINVLPPASILTQEEFNQLASQQANYRASTRDKFRNKRNTYRALRSSRSILSPVLIPNWEMIPVLDWSYGCSPTSAAMALGFWDYNSINSSKNYSNLILNRYTRWDDLQSETDYQVPDLQYILAIGMQTDTLTGSTSSEHFEDGIEYATNTVRGYNFNVDRDASGEWPSLKNRVDEGRTSLWSTDDTNGTGIGHTWCAFGYDNSTDEVATYDTWAPGVHWIDKDGHGDADITEIYEGGHTGYSINLAHPLGDTIYNHDGSGEVYEAGDVCEISWITDIHDGSRDVDIWLSTTGNGGNHSRSIVSHTENDGIYDWLIPDDINSSECRIGVWLHGPGSVEGGDGSVGNFIINPGGSVPYLVSGVTETAPKNPDYYLLSHTEASWAIVGAKNLFSERFIDLELFSDDTFIDKEYEGNGSSDTDWFLIDGNHASQIDRGVKVKTHTIHSPIGTTEIEYEGDNVSLSVGLNSGFSWALDDVVKVYDVHLEPGMYSFRLDPLGTGSLVDLNIALYGSSPGNRIKGRNEWINASYSDIWGGSEEFTATITVEDDYAFAIWNPNNGQDEFVIDIRKLQAGTWRGDISSDWHDPGNWDFGFIPVGTTDVYVGNRINNPSIYNGPATCRDIKVETSAQLAVSDVTFTANGDMDLFGDLILHGGSNSNTEVHVLGDIGWYGYAHGQMDPGTELYVHGDWTFQSLSVYLNEGDVIFSGYGTSNVYVHTDDCWFPSVINRKMNNAEVVLQMTPYPMIVKGSYTGESGSVFRNNTLNQMVIEGPELRVNAGSVYMFSAGSTDFKGGVTDIYMNPQSQFYDLSIEPNDSVYLKTDIKVGDDLYIRNGVLHCTGNTIEILGDWRNYVGYQGFHQGVSMVSFMGTGVQILENEAFHHMEVDKPTGDLRVTTGHSYCMHYHGTQGEFGIRGGDFTSNNMVGEGIFGTLRITSGTMTINQGSSDYMDLSGHLIMEGGELIVNGGQGDSFWPYNQDATIDMNAGTIVFNDIGLVISTSGGLDLDANISGGTIKTKERFRVSRDDFNPSGGTVELIGDATSTLEVDFNSNLYNLIINKTGGSGVNALNAVHCLNDFKIQSGFYDAGDDLYVGGDWYNEVGASGFEEDTFTVIFYDYAPSTLYDAETFYNLVINKDDAVNNQTVFDTDIQVIVVHELDIQDGELQLSDNNLVDIGGDLRIGSGALLNAENGDNIEIEVGGDWKNINSTCNSSRGVLVGNSTVTFDGWANQNIYTNCTESIFNDLVIENHDFNVQCWNPTRVAGDFTLIKGTYHSHDTLWIGGDFNYMNVPGAFEHHDGVVIFDGDEAADIPYGVTFYDVILDKTYADFDGLELGAGISFYVEGDLDIDDGTLEMNDGSTLHLSGDLTIEIGAGLNGRDDTNIDIIVGGDWTDHNTSNNAVRGFSPGNSMVTFNGSNRHQTIRCNAPQAAFYGLKVDKYADPGLKDYLIIRTDMQIQEDLRVVDGCWYDMPSSGYNHQFYGSLTVDKNANWVGGNCTISFVGKTNQEWTPSPVMTDCDFYNITIDKPAGTLDLLGDAHSTSGAFLSVRSGTLNLNGHLLHVGGNAEILKNATVINDKGGELRVGN
jgi:hypothetical protein